MRLVSVNVSAGRVVSWRGKRIETGIFKEPVAGRVMVRRSNLDGDRQADRSVHGGEHKAVYAYAADHYAWWRRELSREIPFGMFGENLTIEAFPEHDVCVGDVFRVDPEMERAQVERLRALRARREVAPWRSALAALEDRARSGENLLPALVEAVSTWATVGEIADRLRGVFGEHRETLVL